MPCSHDPPSCLAFDLEVTTNDRRIHRIGAVRADTGERFTLAGREARTWLARLDALAEGASFVLGHNIIAFDLPILAAAKPDLDLLLLPVVDTLRLNPLAFPANPYHRLVKHYRDGALRSEQRNNPEHDSELALELFQDQREALSKMPSDLLAAWHRLCTTCVEERDRALDGIFARIRQAARPTSEGAVEAIASRLDGTACIVAGREILETVEDHGWELAYALAWLHVAGGNSVVPPWVRHQFPGTQGIIERLREIACAHPDCAWCRERHDATRELKRWFGFDEFRPEPTMEDGRPMQQAIVETTMAGRHVLGILPTGTGKSVCYQIPALSRYDKAGALTVVISPLVALMADQVAGLEAAGIGACVTVNGMLSIPERSDALDRVRLGDAGILLIAPEQLRSRSVLKVLDQRRIGGWVLDEAHCLSRWGHDFRPDYRYVARYIGRRAGDAAIPPVMCLTATAKPDVVEDIARHFREEVGIELDILNGGAERNNLHFEVIRTAAGEKFSDIHSVLTSYLPADRPGGAIVYCATRRQSEDIAEYLQLKGILAEHFHAGLTPEKKKDVQQRFIAGGLIAIVATNAFGMGIDKPDVRLVIHADIPGSLENYLQEAGRAGRDREPARCVLMYTTDDVERQFGMSARSRLTRREIHGILRALRNLDRRKRLDGKVVATPGEILIEDDEAAFERDPVTDDTRVRTGVAWLEEAVLLSREENDVRVFPSSLRIGTVDEARAIVARRSGIHENHRKSLLSIATALLEADPDEGVSTDDLMMVSGLGPGGVRKALYDLEVLGISSNDTALTAFVHVAVERSSRKRLQQAGELERALITYMREAAPDLGKGEASTLHLRIASQAMRDQGLADPLPERLWRIVHGIASDGRGEDNTGGSLDVRKRDAETVSVRLRREWDSLEETALLRRTAAAHLLDHLTGCLPDGIRGTDLLAETTLGELRAAIDSDLVIRARVSDTSRLLDRSLMWLHEQEVVRLNKGLTVFRSAMTIRLEDGTRGFAAVDFEPLRLHYEGKVLQIHIMAEFAQRGLEAIGEALNLAMDYFSLRESDFFEKWLSGRDKEIGRETTPDSWNRIVEVLGNPEQKRIVADSREQTNVLVLAGPGSGKTRVLVHRIAWLVRVKRENPRRILALAYNRHAAVEIRQRLLDLIGDDARGVTVLTCHAMAMRLAGASFAASAERPDDEMFKSILRQAVAVLKGDGLEPEEADERRERLLTGFRWILVDEYQDIGPDQYELISALAGRTLTDDDAKLTIFAVGDDDQNIYAFNGASVEFIRKFEKDYGPRPFHLTSNYRSTGHIVEVANAMIEPAGERMKSGHPGGVDHGRAGDPRGGIWQGLDPVSKGRVQILPAGCDPVFQARVVMTELLRLSCLPGIWDWSRCAVIAREWTNLDPVRAFCETQDIPVQMANEEPPGFWRLRETAAFVAWLRGKDPRIVDDTALRGWQETRPGGPWYELLCQAIVEWRLETGGAETPVDRFIEWLAEWGRDVRRRQHGLLLLSGHRAKGLEFDHVAVLDGGWERVGRGEDRDAPRRLYYVAMTRARQTLTLARFEGRNRLLDDLADSRSILVRDAFEPHPGSPALHHRHVRCSLKDVDLGFAGRNNTWSPVHEAIAGLAPGDSLDMRENRELLDRKGRLVGRLSRHFQAPEGMKCRSAAVMAVVNWNRSSSDPDYLDRIRCETWETVVPEFVFEPENG